MTPDLFVCPDCREPLSAAADCLSCGKEFSVRGGIFELVDPKTIQGVDRLMRGIYNGLGLLHDPAVRYVLPHFDGQSEEELRRKCLELLDLDELANAAHVNVLEVGVGTGNNIARILDELPGSSVSYYGIDLSSTMLASCRRRIAREQLEHVVHLAYADAHDLPFRDATFDRVVSIGALGGFRDPAAALAEMARVARPGTPIVVMDEQLDPDGPSTLLERGFFKAMTFYQRSARSPLEFLPPGSRSIVEAQLGKMFYGLAFRVG